MNLRHVIRDFWAAVTHLYRGERDPFLAPWPPGVNYREIPLPSGLTLWQLREGAALPEKVYHSMRRAACGRASWQSRNPCLN